MATEATAVVKPTCSLMCSIDCVLGRKIARKMTGEVGTQINSWRLKAGGLKILVPPFVLFFGYVCVHFNKATLRASIPVSIVFKFIPKMQL